MQMRKVCAPPHIRECNITITLSFFQPPQWNNVPKSKYLHSIARRAERQHRVTLMVSKFIAADFLIAFEQFITMIMWTLTLKVKYSDSPLDGTYGTYDGEKRYLHSIKNAPRHPRRLCVKLINATQTNARRHSVGGMKLRSEIEQPRKMFSI